MSRRFLSVEDFSEGISRSRDVNTNIPFAENYRNVKSTKQSEVIIAAYTNANYNELQNYKNDITELEENKQDKLTAGNNITITDENVISSVDTTYTAGTGIDIDEGVINCTVTDTTYTAGSNIQISAENVISATDTTYTAGNGIDITGNVISATGGAAAWGNITGNIEDQTDLQTALNDKQDVLTAGSNISIDSDNIISATNTTYSAGTGININASNQISCTVTQPTIETTHKTGNSNAYACNYINKTTDISTTEQVVGYDNNTNKTIYKKTWTGTITGEYSGSYYQNLSGVNNVYEVIKAYGYISDTNTNGGNQFYLGYNAQDCRLVKISSGSLRIDTISSFYGKYFKITVEYTKSS